MILTKGRMKLVKVTHFITIELSKILWAMNDFRHLSPKRGLQNVDYPKLAEREEPHEQAARGDSVED